MSDKKTMLPEVLPLPAPLTQRSPRERAQRRLEQLTKKAALAGAAGSLTACMCYGVVDPLPPPAQQCAPDDEPSTWLTVSLLSAPDADPLVVSLILRPTFEIEGLAFADADAVAVEGATVVDSSFDGAQSLELTLDVDDGAAAVTLRPNVSCDGTVRELLVLIDVPAGTIFVRDAN